MSNTEQTMPYSAEYRTTEHNFNTLHTIRV